MRSDEDLFLLLAHVAARVQLLDDAASSPHAARLPRKPLPTSARPTASGWFVMERASLAVPGPLLFLLFVTRTPWAGAAPRGIPRRQTGRCEASVNGAERERKRTCVRPLP